MDPKSFLSSKTLWFNVLTGLVLVANAFGFVDFVPNEQLAEYAAVVITLVNVLLRFVTKQAITFKAQ